MNGTSGFLEVRSSTSDHHLDSSTSKGLNSEKDPDTFSVLTIPSVSPQTSEQSNI